MFIVEALLT